MPLSQFELGDEKRWKVLSVLSTVTYIDKVMAQSVFRVVSQEQTPKGREEELYLDARTFEIEATELTHALNHEPRKTFPLLERVRKLKNQRK